MTCEKHYWYHGPLVDCPHCEIDRLRTELEDKNKLLDSCSMQLNETASERNSLRAELARRPTDVLCLGKHGQITVLTDCPECVKEELAKAQERETALMSIIDDTGVKLQLYSNDNEKRYITELIARAEAAEASLAAISSAIGTTKYMDPPDGGSVTLAEQVARMSARISELELALSEQYVKGMEEVARLGRNVEMYEGNWLADPVTMIERFEGAIYSRIAELEKEEEAKNFLSSSLMSERY